MNLFAPPIPTTHSQDAALLTFPLAEGGYIDHWLLAGPQSIPVTNLEDYEDEQPRPGIIRDYYNPELFVAVPPAEGENLHIEDKHGRCTLPWRVVTCAADHFIDLSTFGYTCQYIRSWAHTTILSKNEKSQVPFLVTANGPFDVWINGVHLHRHADFHFQVPASFALTADLLPGENHIVISYEVIAIRECPYALGVQIQEAGLEICLRTTFPLEKRRNISTALASAELDRSSFLGEESIRVTWPKHLKESCKLRIELQRAGGSAEHEIEILAASGATADLGPANRFPDGLYHLVLTPSEPMDLSRKIPLRIVNGDHSVQPYRTYQARRREALEAAANHRHFFSEFAKMQLGYWDRLRRELWTEPLRRLRQRGDCSDFFLLGMLGALYRHGSDPMFPKLLREEITDAAINFRYWRDEPGHDAMCFHTENHQILFHACEVLAGQLFPEQVFPNAGQTGEWHRKKGEKLAMRWLRQRGREGFQEWDSNVYFEIDVVALTHLADLAESPELATLAAMVLDKLFATIAMNSFQGVFGSTHGRVYTECIKGGRLELTSGISRLLWGMGTFNEHILGTVSLACSTYRLPDAIYAIGAEPPGEAWSKERQGGSFDPQFDCRSGSWEVNKVCYKTDNYMLCSAQDYLPGNPGNQQHIWQATLGPDAVVFTTHPVCLGEDSYHRPNFWHGNGILPRVVQWKDFLLALYHLPTGDWMGFTHAYFPTIRFDEWTLREDWAFARKNDGYIALTAFRGLQLCQSITGAREELRSSGLENTWICQMGRREQDGSFQRFQDRILALSPELRANSFRGKTLRGDHVEFSWSGPLLVNGNEVKTRDFPHCEGPFAKSEGPGEIVYRSRTSYLQLDFRSTRREMGPL